MSLKPYLSSKTGQITEEAREHVRRTGVTYTRYLKAGCVVCGTTEGAAVCPGCFTHLTCPATYECPECLPFRTKRPARR